MRGSNLLFSDIFPVAVPDKQRRGRSETYDLNRNECLISSYYYFATQSGFRYELLIKIISKQFWLSETTVRNILALNHDILIRVRNEKPTKSALKKRWPWVSWEVPSLADYI